MITEYALGKLYIAGEYAVLEETSPAILVALDEFVSVSINKSKKHVGTIHSKQYSQDAVHWTREENKMVLDNRDNPFHFILSGIYYAEQYVLENQGELDIFDLNINSELDAKDGRKYGLGSSAAVTVATVKAVLSFYGVKLDKSLVFKLAAIAHLKVQGNGSLGDIAASVYGGWIAYQSFDKKSVLAELENRPLTDVLNLAWPQLKIKLLTPPKDLELIIGWSGIPAYTSQLVDKTDQAKTKYPEKYQNFVNETRNCILRMIEGFETGDTSKIQNEIRYNRLLLQSLADMSHVQIEIPKLTKLIEIAELNHGAAKTSGAGNGDCAIVIADSHTTVDQMKSQWLDEDITPLDFKVHSL
ncbi:phosphomevalonate kinase [Holzapfeliella sp. JNUCC 72]